MNNIINYQQLAQDWLTTNNPSLTQTQIKQFIMFCRMYQLNPWKNEAYAVSFGGKLTLVTNYLVICARAKQNPKYYREKITYWKDGVEMKHPHLTPSNSAGVVVCVEIYDQEGTMISSYDWDIQENMLANKGSFKNNYFTSWVEKCAITNALRRTFPNEVGGLYIPEEFNAQNESVSVKTANPVKTIPTLSADFKAILKDLKKLLPSPEAMQDFMTNYAQEHKLTLKQLQTGDFNLEPLRAMVENMKETKGATE